MELIAGLKAVGARVKYHACGNTKALLPFFSELGADIINLDSLIDLKEAKRVLGNHVCIKGNFDPTAILLQGKPETVKKAARQCIREEEVDGGFILSPGCEVPRNTPPENLEALITVAKTDGVYPLNLDKFLHI